MLIFILPCEGRPFLYNTLNPANIKDELVKNLEEAVGGRAEKLYFDLIITSGVRIHPMFKENEKWAIAETLLRNVNSRVYKNADGSIECSPNTATFITKIRRRIMGCPHLFGDIAICISQTNYKSICDKPLEFWGKPSLDGDYDDDDDDDDDGCECCEVHCHQHHAKCSNKKGEFTNFFSCRRESNRFIVDDGTTVHIFYNDDGSFKYLTYERFGIMNPAPAEGARLIRKIDDDSGETLVKLVSKDYKLVGDEAVVCDYDRQY